MGKFDSTKILIHTLAVITPNNLKLRQLLTDEDFTTNCSSKKCLVLHCLAYNAYFVIVWYRPSGE